MVLIVHKVEIFDGKQMQRKKREKDTYSIYTEGFYEVATESCPEWDLNTRPLNSVQAL